MFRPHLSYIAAISVNRRTSGYPWRGGPVRSDFQWRLLYPVNLRCLARSGRWRQRSSKWLGMLVIMLWTRCQVLISHLHNSWILNHSTLQWPTVTLGWPIVNLRWPIVTLWWPAVTPRWPTVTLRWPKVTLHTSPYLHQLTWATSGH